LRKGLTDSCALRWVTVVPVLIFLGVVGGCWLGGCQAKQKPQRTFEKVDTRIRVRLLSAGNPVVVSTAGSCRLVDQTDRQVAGLGGKRRVKIENLGGRIAVNGQVHEGMQCLRIIPADQGCRLAVDGRPYRGELWVYKLGSSGLMTVNVVQVEQYLKGVLAAELPARFHRRAYEAQAIAARTYALYQKMTLGKGRLYDVVDTEGSQVYRGRVAENAKAVAAVQATLGIVLTFDSGDGAKIFCPYYSSTCGGWTQDATNVKNVKRIKPLAGGVRCDYCRKSPYYRWGPVTLDGSVIAERVNRRYPSLKLGAIRSIEPVKLDPHGRLVLVRLTDGNGRDAVLRGEDFRLSIGSRVLPSTFCKVRREGRRFVFYDGRGFGHGMGMCQFGADGMARAGFTAPQILRHYYPGARLIRAY